MRILLTGAAGQLGRAFLETVGPRHEVVPAHHRDAPAGAVALDLARPETLRERVRGLRPDWVVHGAAMTNVDACEKDPALALVLNGVATGEIARGAADAGARLLYVSTDYVFDGAKGRYVETDLVGPINAYGESKLAGERAALEALPDAVVARTSVVYGPHKKNFVTWLVDELRHGRPARIVTDQVVTPTLAHDLAAQALALVEADAQGVFHAAGATRVSRFGMAQEVARTFGLDASLLSPVRSDALSWAARRPLDTSLDTSKVLKYRAPLALDAALRTLRGKMEGTT